MHFLFHPTPANRLDSYLSFYPPDQCLISLKAKLLCIISRRMKAFCSSTFLFSDMINITVTRSFCSKVAAQDAGGQEAVCEGSAISWREKAVFIASVVLVSPGYSERKAHSVIFLSPFIFFSLLSVIGLWFFLLRFLSTTGSMLVRACLLSKSLLAYKFAGPICSYKTSQLILHPKAVFSGSDTQTL